MIKTLQLYIGKDLLKVTLLAVIAFTILLSIIAIIEPLRREQGMGPAQVIALFLYALPVTLSLAMPIAALFATTLVYGRFSQDNELLASRASGVSTMTLLKPAWLLGLAVTGLSLVLVNYVAPAMTANSKALQQNIKGASYRSMRTKGVLKIPGQNVLIHGDAISEGKDGDRLDGLVSVNAKDPEDPRFLSASEAYLSFSEPQGRSYLQVMLVDPSVGTVDGKSILRESTQEISYEVSNPLKESPTFLEWDRLLETAANPWLSSDIARDLERIRRDIAHDLVLRHVEAAINQRRVYSDLRSISATGQLDREVLVKAAGAKVHTEFDKRSRRPANYVQLVGDAATKPQIIIREAGRQSTYTGDEHSTIVLEAGLSPASEVSQVNLSFTGNIVQTVVTLGPGPLTDVSMIEPRRLSSFQTGQLPLPAPVQEKIDRCSLADIYRDGRDMTANAKIRSDLDNIVGGPGRENRKEASSTEKLIREIKAELHGRVAFSISGLLLVSLGAALGMMFRGGQFLTAFALTAIPGLSVMITWFAGKVMLKNANVDQLYGMLLIWLGIVLLLCANLVVYMRLARK